MTATAKATTQKGIAIDTSGTVFFRNDGKGNGKDKTANFYGLPRKYSVFSRKDDNGKDKRQRQRRKAKRQKRLDCHENSTNFYGMTATTTAKATTQKGIAIDTSGTVFSRNDDNGERQNDKKWRNRV